MHGFSLLTLLLLPIATPPSPAPMLLPPAPPLCVKLTYATAAASYPCRCDDYPRHLPLPTWLERHPYAVRLANLVA